MDYSKLSDSDLMLHAWSALAGVEGHAPWLVDSELVAALLERTRAVPAAAEGRDPNGCCAAYNAVCFCKPRLDEE